MCGENVPLPPYDENVDYFQQYSCLFERNKALLTDFEGHAKERNALIERL